MHARRVPGSEPVRTDAAARRLALIAVDAGGGPPAPSAPPAPPAEAGTDEAWWADHTRVAGVVLADEGVAPALPQPGRHAARRPRGWARPGWAAALRGRAPGLGPAHVAVVALVVALGLAVTTWWVARDRPEPVAPVSGEPVAPLVGAGASPSPAGATAAPSAGSVTVDVAGKVRRPGIVVLDQGSRVADALEAAGGVRRGVDLTPLNLARVLVDGEQVVVGGPAGAPGPGVPAGPAAGATGPGGTLVNLNTAAQPELETLPGVGPVTAQAIIAWREENGGFTSIDELLEVDGIGDKTLATLTPHVTV